MKRRTFETRPYKCRIFVTNLKDRIPLVVWFYNQSAGAENLIKEANNDAAHPSGRFDVNRNHFQLAMLGLQPEHLADDVQPRALFFLP